MNRFRGFVLLLLFTLLCTIPGHAQGLKLLISVEQRNIVAPNPVHATLHFHNSGKQTIWLYRPVRSTLSTGPGNNPLGLSEQSPGQSSNGSLLEIHLVSMNSPASGNKTDFEGHGSALVPAALPHPRLVRLEPGNDYEERVNIYVEPAKPKTGGTDKSVWGHYSFSVTYSANYSNAEILARDINAHLWAGRVSSNDITLNLQPSTGRGSITGTVLDAVGRPYDGALVTLGDYNETSLNQVYSDGNGQFSFSHLPLGRYWITVRDPGSRRDTSVFRLVDLKQAKSPATAQIMMLPVEVNRPDRLLHKPVLFHIIDNRGRPLANVKLAILLTAKNVVENVKAQTREDGFAVVNLIPGLNLVTLRYHGCENELRQADVAYGPGVDGFKFVFDCTRK